MIPVYLDGHSGVVLPVPISNTEVKRARVSEQYCLHGREYRKAVLLF